MVLCLQSGLNINQNKLYKTIYNTESALKNALGN